MFRSIFLLFAEGGLFLKPILVFFSSAPLPWIFVCIQISTEVLRKWVTLYGPFDLVIGGSPCNNFTGNNRVSKDKPTGRAGLDGKDSRLFMQFVNVVKEILLIQNAEL